MRFKLQPNGSIVGGANLGGRLSRVLLVWAVCTEGVVGLSSEKRLLAIVRGKLERGGNGNPPRTSFKGRTAANGLLRGKGC